MFIIRILIGSILLMSGFQKAISPAANFMYVMQAYAIFPSLLEYPIALILPWLEIIVGFGCLLGLWTRQALLGAMGLFAGFVIIIGQALLRKLPLESCGCFGSLLPIPPEKMLLIDSGIVLLLFISLLKIQSTNRFSLDKYFKT